MHAEKTTQVDVVRLDQHFPGGCLLLKGLLAGHLLPHKLHGGDTGNVARREWRAQRL